MLKYTAHFCSVVLGFALLNAAQPAAAQKFTANYSEVSLISEMRGMISGSRAWVGLHIKTKPGWHTYWQNPGDSGLATQIKWSLPDGVSAGDIHWPIPKKFKTGPVTSYGYKDETLLMVPLTVDKQVKTGDVAIKANARWLVCEEICVPEQASFSISLPILNKADAGMAALFQAYRKKLPADPGVPDPNRRSGFELPLIALPAIGPRLIG